MSRSSDTTPEQDQWMEMALGVAAQGAGIGEVPVGAVVVSAVGQLLGRGCNQPISSHDPTAHAEIVALRQAALAQKNYRLPGCTLYVTIEPCTMCVGALIHARIATLVFGAREPKAGAVFSHPYSLTNPGLNHEIKIIEGIAKEACAQMVQEFFATRRQL